MLPHSFQHDAGDETTVIYTKLKITPEVKEVAAAQVGEKVKEAAQTAEEMQRDGGELADQSNKEEENKDESEYMHVH